MIIISSKDMDTTVNEDSQWVKTAVPYFHCYKMPIICKITDVKMLIKDFRRKLI